jgi:hypothetical protein
MSKDMIDLIHQKDERDKDKARASKPQRKKGPPAPGKNLPPVVKNPLLKEEKKSKKL